MEKLSYLWALLRVCWRTHLNGLAHTLFLGFMMFFQNFAFFLMWMIFFHSVDDVNGWHLKQVGILFGFVGSTYGFSLFFCDGPRTLPAQVMDGSFDAFLTKPRSPLMPFLLSRTNAASLGDLLSGPFYWIVFCGMTWGEVALALLLSMLVAVLVTSVMLIFFSLVFWLKQAGKFADQLFEMLIIFSAAPSTGQPLAVQVMMFSIIPAGFVGLMPANLIDQFDMGAFVILVAAVLFYAILGAYVFHLGVKRYRQGG